MTIAVLVEADRRLCLAEPEAIIDVLQSLSGDASRVLVVGHNLGLGELIALVNGETKVFPAAALAQAQLSISPRVQLRISTRGRLVKVWTPKEVSS